MSKKKNNKIAGAAIVLLTAGIVTVGFAAKSHTPEKQKIPDDPVESITEKLPEWKQEILNETKEWSTELLETEQQFLIGNSSTVVDRGGFTNVENGLNFSTAVGTTTGSTTTTKPTTTSGTTTKSTSGTTTTRATTAQSTTSGTKTTTTTTTKVSTAGTTLHNYGVGEDYEYAYAGFKPQSAKMQNKGQWELALVNRDYILPNDYSPPKGLAEAAKGTGVYLDARVAPHYQEMYDAALKDGITLTPLSGNRRISTQRNNFENKIQKYMNQGYDRIKATQMAAEIILPPGTSEHNAGLAMDIISLDVSFENSKAYQWLDANAQDYGFILRYPKSEDKRKITKITYEPWHWRYVGKENAQKIKSSGQTLEEYLGYA